MFVAIFLSTKRPKRIVTTFMHHCQATKWTKSLTCCQKLFKKFVVADVVDSAKFAAKLNFLQEAFRLFHRCDRVHQPVQVYQFSNLLLSQQRAAGLVFLQRKHCTAGLSSSTVLDSAALLHTINNIFSSLVESKPVKLETSCIMILPMVSVLLSTARTPLMPLE